MGPGLDLGNLLVHLRLNDSQFIKSMRNIEQKMKATADKLTSIGTKMTVAVTLPLTLFAKSSVKAFSEFDLKMTESLAIMGDVSEGMRSEMEQTARSLSMRGVKSSVDLAESYFFLASAGLNAKQSIAALPQVMQFATAGTFSMSEATDLATDAQSALGLRVDDAAQNLKNLTRVTDVLVGANTLANASTRQFSLALTNDAGAAMKYMNISMEEGVAVLAAYADQGIKAQEAGNMFGRMLRLMTKGFQENRAAWETFGVDLFENGRYREIADIIGDITFRLNQLTPEAKSAQLAMLGFEARSQKSVTPLLGMADAMRKNYTALKSIGGITDEVANKQLKAFHNQMLIAKNHLTAMREEIGKKFQPILIKLGEAVKTASLWFLQLDDSTKGLLIKIGTMIAVIGPAILSIGLLGKAILFVKATIFALAPIVGAIALVGTAVYTLATAWRNNFKGMRDITESFVDTVMSWFGKLTSRIDEYNDRIKKSVEVSRKVNEALIAELAKGTFNPEVRAGRKAPMDPAVLVRIKKDTEDVGKIGKSFKELWALNVEQAKKDAESLSKWMRNLSGKLAADDPLLKTVQNLQEQSNILREGVKETMDIVVKEADKIPKVVQGFTDVATTRFAEFQTSLTSITEQGLMAIARNWEDWGATVKNVLKEVYYEALRVALIAPMAQSLSGGLTGAAKGLFKGLNIGTEAVPVTATGADGGYVGRTGFALIHKGETLSGTEGQYGGNLTLKLHYEGQPLVMSKEQSYMQSDQRIKEVWLSLADNDMAVRNRLKQG